MSDQGSAQLRRIGGNLKRHGLQNLGKELIRIAGGVIKRHPIGGILDDTGILDSVGEALGIEPRNRQDLDVLEKATMELPAEQLAALAQLQSARDAVKLAEIQAGSNQENNLTDRHRSDMMSDNRLSKNIRPAMLIALTASASLYTHVCLWAVIFAKVLGTSLDISETQRALISAGGTTLWLAASTALAFYFGGRSWEKRGSMFASSKSGE